jgi:hypothetical protein
LEMWTAEFEAKNALTCFKTGGRPAGRTAIREASSVGVRSRCWEWCHTRNWSSNRQVLHPKSDMLPDTDWQINHTAGRMKAPELKQQAL